MNEKLTKDNKDSIKKQFQAALADGIEESDLVYAAEKGKSKLEAIAINVRGKFEEMIKILSVMISMLSDYKNGTYREIPVGSVAAVVIAVLYFINPFDVIPDIVPGVGYADDAFIVLLALKLVQTDLDAYEKWKASLT